jgi:hypothetical protein
VGSGGIDFSRLPLCYQNASHDIILKSKAPSQGDQGLLENYREFQETLYRLYSRRS